MLDSPINNLACALDTASFLARDASGEVHPAYKEWALQVLSMKIARPEDKPKHLSSKAIEAIVKGLEWPIKPQSDKPLKHIRDTIEKKAMEFLNHENNLRYLLEAAFDRMTSHINRAGLTFQTKVEQTEAQVIHLALGTAAYVCRQRQIQIAEDPKAAADAMSTYQKQGDDLMREFEAWLAIPQENCLLIPIEPPADADMKQIIPPAEESPEPPQA